MKILEDFDSYYDQSVKVWHDRSINVDTSHRCLLACQFCARQNEAHGNLVVKTYGSQYGDIKPEHMKMLGDNFNRLSLCGQISDPIYHKDWPSVMRAIKDCNATYVDFHTNGSGKKESWWKEVIDICNESSYQPTWIFGIDGIDQKCSIHRVHQNFESSWSAMEYVVNNIRRDTGRVVWQFIPFAYNEDEIDTAVQMAEDLGVDFLLLKSGRFRENSPVAPPKNQTLISKNFFSERNIVKNENRT